MTVTTYGICTGGGVASKLKYRVEPARIGAAVSRKTEVAHCPDGYKVTGGGVVNIDAAYSETEVKVTRPANDGTAWEGQVRNFGAGSGSIRVHAICATGGFAKDLVYRSKSGTADDGTQGFRAANCPGNSRVVSGGVKVKKAAAHLNSSYPISESGWGSYVDALLGDANFTTYAVCKT